jgi:hypothetical protein
MSNMWEVTRQYPELYQDWQQEVANGGTLLGFEEWNNPELAASRRASDEFLEEDRPTAGDVIEHDGRQILVQFTRETDDGLHVLGRYIADDGSVEALADVYI